MVAFPDPYWAAASEAALRALDEADYVLVPAEFLSLSQRFAPLEYSWGCQGTPRLAWCCSKDDVDRLAPWLHTSSGGDACYQWSNEVFVLGGSFEWSKPADAKSRRHLAAWHERLRRYRAGVPARAANERPALLSPTKQADRHVLVVGASNMGNVGDDLLAEVLAELLDALGAQVSLAGPDIDPLRVANYDAVVVGGGGLVYASHDGSNETQNLANYLKFGPIGEHFGVPTGLIGVGDQDHARGLERDELTRRFSRNAIAQFQQVTARDPDSTELLRQLGAQHPKAGCDLLFHWTERAGKAVRPSLTQPARIALVGEFYNYDVFVRGIADGGGSLVSGLQDGDFDVLVMSNDDEAHARRLQNALQHAGASAAIVDLRGRTFDALVFLFASYQGIITTRFHGLVLAAMMGARVLALDVAHGKKARLLRALGAEHLLVQDGSDDGISKLARALAGRLEPVPVASVREHAAQISVHRAGLQALLRQSKTHPSDVSTVADRRPVVGREKKAGAALRASALQEEQSIGLCWAASSPDTNGFANLGDSLSAVMVAGLSGRAVRHVGFEEPSTKLVAVGSIGHAIRGGLAVVWGAGVSIRGGLLAENVPVTRYDIRAVRGPISAQHYRDFGINVPDVFGDPVWLLPSIFNGPVEKRYELGVIPHIRDVDMHHPDAAAKPDSLRYVVDESEQNDILLLNTWHEPSWDGLLAKLRLILSCKRIVSQSFHGVVIAEAYGIPVLNIRYMPGMENGSLRIDLEQECKTDPRVWEFYKGGPRRHFHMYTQRRNERTDWQAVIRSIDALWEPFEYDAGPLVEAFPIPLGYDPLHERLASHEHLHALEL